MSLFEALSRVGVGALVGGVVGAGLILWLEPTEVAASTVVLFVCVLAGSVAGRLLAKRRRNRRPRA